MKTNVNTNKENSVFSNLAHTWWDETGPFKALHAMNPVRIKYILNHIQSHCPQDSSEITILDAGCGGGLISAPFARLGYEVTGIDTSEEAIAVAQEYANEYQLDITFEQTKLSNITKQFDVIFLLEILEHVENYKQLLKDAAHLLKPGGLIFFSTLNRTMFSYLGGILVAENILKWAPKGAHQWSSFLKPSEIVLPLQQSGIQTLNLKGIKWSIIERKWKISQKLSGNYIGVGKKDGG